MLPFFFLIFFNYFFGYYYLTLINIIIIIYYVYYSRIYKCQYCYNYTFINLIAEEGLNSDITIAFVNNYNNIQLYYKKNIKKY